MQELRIQSGENQKLNKYLLRYLNQAPKSLIHKFLRKKFITLNGKKAAGNEDLKEGDIIKIFLPPQSLAELTVKKILPSYTGLKIVYEDHNLLIADKPKGLLSHPSKDEQICLIYNILAYLKGSGQYPAGSFTPALVNRLDRNTSGLVMCGKNLAAAQTLNKLIREHKIHKFYKAIVQGKLTRKNRLESYHAKDEKKNRADYTKNPEKDRSKAITIYQPSEIFQNHTCLEIQPITGKFHQIRAHLQSIGHPIAGDGKYGGASPLASGQLLMAYKLLFYDTKNTILEYLEGKTFVIENSKEFEAALKNLRRMYKLGATLKS